MKPEESCMKEHRIKSKGAEGVADNNRLLVKGAFLVNQRGEKVALKGVSTHGINVYPKYVSEEMFRELRDTWGVTCIRLAMYTEEYNGYCNGGNQEELKELIDKGVLAATNAGMYVIVDWHILSDGEPRKNQREAEIFFDEISKKYSGHENVLYEICNEPNGMVSWKDVKSYAESIIKIIRLNDKKNVILVGSPNWSQDVDQAALDPITGYDNIMYTLHFYAATHKEPLRLKLQKATAAGLPIFVSEFGISDASGNGTLDIGSGNQWIDLLKSHSISYVCWNLSNKDESSALIRPECTKTFGLLDEDLSEQGKWYKELY